MTSRETALKAAEILNEKKAENIKVLEVKGLTSIGDYFVICNGTSSTHVKSLGDEVEFKLKELGAKQHHSEGYSSASWILLDFGAVVIHIFDREASNFYDLERLWTDAPQLDLSHLN